MAQAPKRPVRLLFKLGKAPVKGRRDSDNPYRFMVKQAALAFAEGEWENMKQKLRDRIASDARGELVNIASEFRRHVIGAPETQRGLVGTLTTKAKGDGAPRVSLGGLPRWAPRGAKYVQSKRHHIGNANWFDNTGWAKRRDSGLLAQTFKSRVEFTGAGTEVNIGSGGILEEMFGGISVQIIRNNNAGGSDGTISSQNFKGKDYKIQIATIRVYALGKVTDTMLQISDQPNTELLQTIAASSAQGSSVALHLRGGRGRYRPALEPYLKFYLQQAIPFAVQRRLDKGLASGTLLRN